MKKISLKLISGFLQKKKETNILKNNKKHFFFFCQVTVLTWFTFFFYCSCYNQYFNHAPSVYKLLNCLYQFHYFFVTKNYVFFVLIE